jgi:hypothetical protein
LLQVVEHECDRISSQHSIRIPSLYRSILDDIQSIADTEHSVHSDTLFTRFPNGLTRRQFTQALQYLHSTRHLVLLKTGVVFTNLVIVAKIAAKFVAPEEVRHSLLQIEEGVQILTQHELGVVLHINESMNCR